MQTHGIGEFVATILQPIANQAAEKVSDDIARFTAAIKKKLQVVTAADITSTDAPHVLREITEPENPHLLSEEQSREIFETRIVPTLLGHAKPHRIEPVAVLITGVPGSGKSTLAQLLAAEYDEESLPVGISPDDYRAFHPGFVEANKKGWEHLETVTIGDCRRWFENSIDHLSAVRASFFPESASLRGGTTERTLALADIPPPAGMRPYRIELAYNATPVGQARLGALQRYQAMVERAGYGRYPGDDLITERSITLPEKARELASDRRLSGYSIFTRDGLFASNVRNADGTWTESEPLSDTVKQAQERRLSLGESKRVIAQYKKLRSRMGPEWQNSLQLAKTELIPVLHPDVGGFQS